MAFVLQSGNYSSFFSGASGAGSALGTGSTLSGAAAAGG
jgi:hypothetical protein